MKPINKEKELFDWLKLNVYPDLLICRNPVSRWDCYSPEQRHRIELKCRKKHYPDLVVEKKKFDAVIQECDKHLDIPIYINSTPQGIYSFNMFKHNGIWELRSMPKTTQFQDRYSIIKEVGYFYVDEAKVLKKF